MSAGLPLKKSLSRLDVFFFLICTLVGLDTLGGVAAKGAQGFLWLAFMAVTFFVPYALLTAELGSAFPEEGGSYFWTKRALGRPIAAVTSVFYWFSNPIWLGGALTISAITTWNTFFFELGPIAKVVFGLVMIWTCVGGAVLSFGAGKWITIVGAWARVALLAFFTFSVALYGVRHGAHGVSLPGFAPTYDGFIGVVPLLFFNFVGFELPSAAGGEMIDPRKAVPYAVLRSAVASVLCYGIPILAILLVVPTERITGLKGFVDAMQTVFTVYGGEVRTAADGSQEVMLQGAGRVLGGIAALGFIGALMTSGTTWIMGADRVQAVACLDGAGPRWLGGFSNRWGTPVALNVASGVVSTVVMLAAFAVAGGSAEKFFAASLNLGISTTAISYLGIFPALYLLRRKEPEVARPYAVPGGARGALVISVVTTGWALLASVSLVWPGFGFRTNADSALPAGFASQRLLFELTQIVPLVLLVGLGLLFLAAGRRDQRASAAPRRARVLRRAAVGASAIALVQVATIGEARADDVPAPAEAPPTAPKSEPIGVSVALSNSLVLRGNPDQSTLLGVLSGSVALNGWLTTFARVGWVHDAPSGAASGNGLANPAAGLSMQLPVGKHLTLGGLAGATAPLGSGGGNKPNPAVMKAWISSVDWGGAMFAVDHVDIFGGGKAAYAVGPMTFQLESTLHQLVRVRGEAIDPIGAAATVTGSQATIAYNVIPHVTLSTAMSETRFWNTPTCIRESPASRRDYFFVAGASLDLEVRGLAVAPGLVYARALDLPLSAEKFQVVELDLGVSL